MGSDSYGTSGTSHGRDNDSYGSSGKTGSGGKDSTFGKILEKAGDVLNNEKLEQKGREKREGAGHGSSNDY